MKLIFNESVWLNGKAVILESETTKNIKVQIHESAYVPWVFWFEIMNEKGILYDSRVDGNVFSNYSSVEGAAIDWYDNYNPMN